MYRTPPNIALIILVRLGKLWFSEEICLQTPWSPIKSALRSFRHGQLSSNPGRIHIALNDNPAKRAWAGLKSVPYPILCLMHILIIPFSFSCSQTRQPHADFPPRLKTKPLVSSHVSRESYGEFLCSIRMYTRYPTRHDLPQRPTEHCVCLDKAVL